jgi:TRAP transporter TatT component family protein
MSALFDLLRTLVVVGAMATGPSPDALYADRENLASAQAAVDALAADLSASPGSFDTAWKLARASYWVGGHVPKPDARAVFLRGIDAGRKAIAAAPDRPEGHFWTAANMGALAESSGIRDGLKYHRPIKDELEWVLQRDPAFMQGSADRALGRWYFKVPGLFGGSKTSAEAHLRASLKYNPNSTASHFFLAELYLDQRRNAEARAELQQVIDAPLDPDWAPEDRGFKARAGDLLKRNSTR